VPARARCADGVEGPPGAALEEFGAASALRTTFSAFLICFDDTSCSASPPSGSVTPARRAQWTSVSSSEPPPRSPAIVRAMESGDDAERGKLGLALTNHVDAGAAQACGLLDEACRSWRRGRRRCDREAARHPMHLQSARKRLSAASALSTRLRPEVRSIAPRALGRQAPSR